MDFVYGNRSRIARMTALTRESLIMPCVIIRIVEDRSIGRSRLTVSGIRIDLIYLTSVRTVYVILVAVPLFRAGNITFPNAGITNLVKIVCFRVPVVEISDNTDSLGMRRPYTEKEALLTVRFRIRSGPEIVITLIVLSRIEKIRLIHEISPTRMGINAHISSFHLL